MAKKPDPNKMPKKPKVKDVMVPGQAGAGMAKGLADTLRGVNKQMKKPRPRGK